MNDFKYRFKYVGDGLFEDMKTNEVLTETSIIYLLNHINNAVLKVNTCEITIGEIIIDMVGE